MTITIGAWVTPALLTPGCLVMIFRPCHPSGGFAFGALFRVVWIVPILVVWLVYFDALAWRLS